MTSFLSTPSAIIFCRLYVLYDRLADGVTAANTGRTWWWKTPIRGALGVPNRAVVACFIMALVAQCGEIPAPQVPWPGALCSGKSKSRHSIEAST
jgi:hypothetical protein